MAEWWYITSFHTSLNCTPYSVLYGQDPPMHLPYFLGTSSNEVVDRSLAQREMVMQMLQFQLQKAQNRMKRHADKRRVEREFSVGDVVYLKLQPYRQFSVQQRTSNKLAPKFYGPYQVIDKVGKVAYRLQLPPTSKIHSTFHVSQLKKCSNPVVPAGVLPVFFNDSLTPKIPEAILERKMVKRGDHAAVRFLIKWEVLPAEESTWMFAEVSYYQSLRQRLFERGVM